MKLYVVDKYTILTGILVILFGIAVFPGLSDLAVPTNAETEKPLPIYAVDTEENKVAITFDVAWEPDDVDEILDTLDEYNAKCTFFIVGEWFDSYPDMVKKMDERGHEIANHSEHHDHYPALSPEQMTKDIAACDSRIKELLGKENILFRAPYGDYNDAVIDTCNQSGHYPIQWNIDSLDWKDLSATEMCDRIFQKEVENGSILLFHTGTEHTAEALPMVLKRLKEEGKACVTVGNLIYRDHYTVDPNGVQTKTK